MIEPHFRGKDDEQFLADLGTALLLIKNERELTLTQMGRDLQCSEDQVARYIAAEAEMGICRWRRAHDKYPELEERMTETVTERTLRLKQRSLNLPMPTPEELAA
jgi:AraC-like DNA-binding protein